MYLETLASEIYHPLFIRDEDSIEELNTMLSGGWMISREPDGTYRPYHIFRIPASAVSRPAIPGTGGDLLWMAMLMRASGKVAQMAVTVPISSSGYFDIDIFDRVLRREWPEWECTLWLPLPGTVMLAILEQDLARGQ